MINITLGVFSLKFQDSLILRRLRDFSKIYLSKKIPLEMKEKNVILIGSASYGNLGDQAIAFAEIDFLKKRFPDYNLVEIYDVDFYGAIQNLRKGLTPNDLIFFTGGGNFGSLYRIAEDQRRLTLKYLGKRNPIIFFPQSIFYEKTPWGGKLLKYTKRLFREYPNLTIVTRELGSYQFANENFKNDVLLVPDIVFSLKENMEENVSKHIKQKVIFSFRNDKEKYISADIQIKLTKIFENRGYALENYDTHIGDSEVIRDNLRNIELIKIWNSFKNANVIVTDRLHGMIFAYITGVPAIVFSNNNPKIKETYFTWLEKSENISYIEEFNLNKIQNIISSYESRNLVEEVDLVPDFNRFEESIKEISKIKRS